MQPSVLFILTEIKETVRFLERRSYNSCKDIIRKKITPAATNNLTTPRVRSWETATMSSAPVPNNALPPGDSGGRATDRIVVYRHSHLFYWWPVWLLGFIFAGVTWWDDSHLAFVPANTKAVQNREVEVERDGKMVKEARDILILDRNQKHDTLKNEEGKHEIVQPRILTTRYHSLGSIYTIVLLLVIVITNVSIRGLWAVFVIVA